MENNVEINVDRINNLIRDLKVGNKNSIQLISYPGNITAARVLLHAYISGSNGS
jgi:hypothetical protein